METWVTILGGSGEVCRLPRSFSQLEERTRPASTKHLKKRGVGIGAQRKAGRYSRGRERSRASFRVKGDGL